MIVNAATPQFLLGGDIQLLLFGGKGGVGKTTCAVAAALHLARQDPEHFYLLLSTDPAHSLSDSLASAALPANLTMCEVDARGCEAAFRTKHGGKLEEIARRGTFLDDEDIRRLMDLTLPGLDELMALLEISRWVEGATFHCIVADTAPTGHTLRLLAVPQFMTDWLQALDALLGKHRYMQEIFGGANTSDEIDGFLLELNASVARMQKLMREPSRCLFIPVTTAEALSVAETVDLLTQVIDLGIPVRDILVNRLVPAGECGVCRKTAAIQRKFLAEIVKLFPAHALWGIPLLPFEVRGAAALEGFWNVMTTLDRWSATPSSSLSGDRPQPWPAVETLVENPAQLLPPGIEIVLFGGKGGVGKTTMACATALHRASTLPDRQVLLVSCDPAHSLADCLELPLGGAPTPVAPRLSAMEIDVQTEFGALKEQYTEELRWFFHSISPNLDLTFDRNVMERFLDLAPPGLDELMALTAITGLLADGGYQTLIIDAAPTGHLLRLLELPETIEAWLKTVFGILLKYKSIMRFPSLSQRLVALSKNVKLLRKVLADPRRSALCAVSILSEMSLAETGDLVQGCRRLGLHIPTLVLNMVTLPGDCPLCESRHRFEAERLSDFRSLFPELHQIVVFRRGEPRGIKALEELGNQLYRATCTVGRQGTASEQ